MWHTAFKSVRRMKDGVLKSAIHQYSKKRKNIKANLCVLLPQKCHVNRKHTQKYTKNKMVENKSKQVSNHNKCKWIKLTY